MKEIRSIETRYKGYRFRSRLEARWAVYFDAMSMPWEYEAQGYHTPSGPYLPDFVVGERLIVEVKPQIIYDKHDDVSQWKKWAAVAKGTGMPLLVVFGPPAADVRTELFDPLLLLSEDPIPVYTTRLSECRRCSAFAIDDYEGGVVAMLWCGPECDSEKWPLPGIAVLRAIEAARAARFEHGEKP